MIWNNNRESAIYRNHLGCIECDQQPLCKSFQDKRRIRIKKKDKGIKCIYPNTYNLSEKDFLLTAIQI